MSAAPTRRASSYRPSPARQVAHARRAVAGIAGRGGETGVESFRKRGIRGGVADRQRLAGERAVDVDPAEVRRHDRRRRGIIVKVGEDCLGRRVVADLGVIRRAEAGQGAERPAGSARVAEDLVRARGGVALPVGPSVVDQVERAVQQQGAAGGKLGGGARRSVARAGSAQEKVGRTAGRESTCAAGKGADIAVARRHLAAGKDGRRASDGAESLKRLAALHLKAPAPVTPVTSKTAELAAAVSPTVIVGEFGMLLLPVVARNNCAARNCRRPGIDVVALEDEAPATTLTGPVKVLFPLRVSVPPLSLMMPAESPPSAIGEEILSSGAALVLG